MIKQLQHKYHALPHNKHRIKDLHHKDANFIKQKESRKEQTMKRLKRALSQSHNQTIAAQTSCITTQQA